MVTFDFNMCDQVRNELYNDSQRLREMFLMKLMLCEYFAHALGWNVIIITRECQS